MDEDGEIGLKLMKIVAQIYVNRYERVKKKIHHVVKTVTLVAVPDT